MNVTCVSDHEVISTGGTLTSFTSGYPRMNIADEPGLFVQKFWPLMVKTRGFVEVETVGIEGAEDEAVKGRDEVAEEVAKATVLEAGVEVAPAIAIVEVGVVVGSLAGGGTATDEDAGTLACLVGRVEDASSRAVETISITADAASVRVEVGVEVGTRGSKTDVSGSKKGSENGAVPIAESGEGCWGGAEEGAVTTGTVAIEEVVTGATVCGGGGVNHPTTNIIGAISTAAIFPSRPPRKLIWFYCTALPSFIVVPKNTNPPYRRVCVLWRWAEVNVAPLLQNPRF